MYPGTGSSPACPVLILLSRRRRTNIHIEIRRLSKNAKVLIHNMVKSNKL